MTNPALFTCPHCGRTSPNKNDIAEGYCGSCHWWTGVPHLYEPWVADMIARFEARQAEGRPPGA